MLIKVLKFSTTFPEPMANEHILPHVWLVWEKLDFGTIARRNERSLWLKRIFEQISVANRQINAIKSNYLNKSFSTTWKLPHPKKQIIFYLPPLHTENL